MTEKYFLNDKVRFSDGSKDKTSIESGGVGGVDFAANFKHLELINPSKINKAKTETFQIHNEGDP